MKNPSGGCAFLRRLLGAATLLSTLATSAHAAGPAVISLDQGTAWSNENRIDFYSRDQGSRIMPLRWMVALKQADGADFLADSLSRYGYLANEHGNPPGLPIGFSVASTANGQVIGMTCAACHTRQITVKDKALRIDGGPAIVDFQAFLTDLDAAVGAALSDAPHFAEFAHAVLSPSASADEVAALRVEVQAWYLPYHLLMDRALPTPPWGPGRLDAVSMIFDRLTGLDLGPPPTYTIAANIQRADAPVRYPFLWNSTRQDKTQWPGFADNGNPILGLARNLGEVTGVFSVFHPKKDDGHLLGVNYVDVNSANYDGLEALERLIERIGPPKWPAAVNPTLVEQGRALFAQTCAACHGVRPGVPRWPLHESWDTPIKVVGTDTREWSILGRVVDPGSLTGAQILDFDGPLTNPALAKDVLGLAVVGTLIQRAVPLSGPSDPWRQNSLANPLIAAQVQALKNAFRQGSAGPVVGGYEARVLKGIWAAAPYLHNGSVPTLAELLKPAAERVATFKIGPAYDLVTVGLAVEQAASSQTLQTTDCSALDSGNSRCGHEYGTRLSPSQKRALLEYLKVL